MAFPKMVHMFSMHVWPAPLLTSSDCKAGGIGIAATPIGMAEMLVGIVVCLD